jgi:rSAM/selenodomain-associated transferase 1
MSAALAVIAKEPVAGRVKTRLCPPCTPHEAAALARAALADTLDAVRATPATRRVVVLDGAPGPWLGPAVDVVPQRGRGLDERLANAFADLGGPAVVIGMDTPQVTPALLAGALTALERQSAVLGPARDGGYWAIGLRAVEPRALLGVPMSRPDTFAAQRARLLALGLAPALLASLTDVDDAATARAVAATLPPAAAFARAARAIGLTAVAA